MITDLVLQNSAIDGTLLAKIDSIGAFVGHTPLRKLQFEPADLYVKLEYNNLSGSIKDRAAYNILSHGIASGDIRSDSTLIESSSGNFALSLCSICRTLGLASVVVIDPNINNAYAQQLNYLASKVIRVTERDETGGYLLTRLQTVKDYCRLNENAYWTNQYENPNNYLAYYDGLGVELCDEFDTLDYAFIGVSTCGTIAGLSLRLKERFPDVKIVAVDIEGSIIFGEPPQKRYISGLGSSKVPPLLAKGRIDSVVNVSQLNIVRGAIELLSEQGIFGGASAGAMYYAAKSVLRKARHAHRSKAVFLCPDKGTAYLDNIYDPAWVERVLQAE